MQERRGTARSRTRLRPGKLLCPDGGFLADCAILDRSRTGARVRPFGGDALPARFRLLDEGEGVARSAEPVWAEAGEIGLRLEDDAHRLDRARFLAVAGPFYAVR